MNWVYILEDLKELEQRIETKLDLLISRNLNPFPFERLQRGKELRSLCRAIRLMIQQHQEDDAKFLLDILKEKGAKLGRA
ncbi:hypothetical protein [Algoriphagus pacificus]|uniref:Uncharacterized protein n=1 Tax=Algoriphagus pacificus TaxID=2811234 RepID=A0ABS3CLS7_9BACT|nr:hypothetical protein [Algoriphagus pacificus]MBN7818046.1 hypothetical protein [Algoriphagus pacificus]